MKDTNKQIHDIIKYNPYREYFGPWSPKYIQDTFQETHKDPFRPLHSIHIGTLSVNTIFDTLWDEMSYNPVRFGETSPFEYDNCFGILHFCTKHKRANGDNDVMHNIAHELMEFSKNVNRVYREFYEIGELKDNYITIRCDANRRPNDEYKMLACLVHCVHLIASQNLQDYKTKQFRDKIQAVVIQRHPALIRSRRYHNFSALDRIATQSDKIYKEIEQTNNDIMDINIRIKTLNEYDPPADTTHEIMELSKKEQELEQLENQYAKIKQYQSKIVSQQTTNEE